MQKFRSIILAEAQKDGGGEEDKGLLLPLPAKGLAKAFEIIDKSFTNQAGPLNLNAPLGKSILPNSGIAGISLGKKKEFNFNDPDSTNIYKMSGAEGNGDSVSSAGNEDNFAQTAAGANNVNSTTGNENASEVFHEGKALPNLQGIVSEPAGGGDAVKSFASAHANAATSGGFRERLANSRNAEHHQNNHSRGD